MFAQVYKGKDKIEDKGKAMSALSIRTRNRNMQRFKPKPDGSYATEETHEMTIC